MQDIKTSTYDNVEVKQASMKVNVKKLHPEAVIPKYSRPGDAGLDLTATSVSWSNDKVTYGTGLAFEIPEGYFGLLVPRSSNAKKDLILTNHAGICDSSYRGEILFVYRHAISAAPVEYEVGDRIGQLLILPYPQIELVEAEELSISERGSGGFGSTGV